MDHLNQAGWITAERVNRRMPVFGKDFMTEEQPKTATVFICGLGAFSLFLQDKEVNEGCLEPGWTDYEKTCLYSEYDVTDYLVKGINRLRVLIGNGMYHVDGNRYTKFQGSFGNPLLILQMKITFQDGHEEIIVTDHTWKTCLGPITFSCIFGGEDYNATFDCWKEKILPENRGWKEAELFTGKIGQLKPAKHPKIIAQKIWEGIEYRTISENRICYDFGRNYAGCVRIHVQGERGQTVKIVPGELLLKSGEINQEFTGDPHHYEYTLSGSGEEEVWAPRFTYYGQRYAVIETDARLLKVCAVEQYADCEQIGSFSCSNQMYNQIHELIVGAIKSNMQSVFTDCPHREKLGWLEETHLIGPGILYDFDAKLLYEKILDDMEDAQTKEGLVPNICPEYVQFDLGFRDSPEWGSACVLLPWYLYERYGDLELLAKHYLLSRRYVEYLLSKSKGYILNHGLGDWLDVGHYPAHPANTPIPITATAILYQDLCIMAKTAEKLEYEADAAMFLVRANACKKAFNEAFFYPLSKNYANGSQTANAMALYLDIVSDQYREKVLTNLEEDIKKREGHFTGGDIGHPYIIKALAKCGKNHLIAQNFMKTDFPSYGYQVQCGATTLCEDWDGPNIENPVMSQNHFMLGAAEEWFYKYLLGVSIDASKKVKIRIAPYFADTVEWVKGSVLTPVGRCFVRWEKKSKSIFLEVKTEKLCEISVCIGGKEEVVVVEGAASWEIA